MHSISFIYLVFMTATHCTTFNQALAPPIILPFFSMCPAYLFAYKRPYILYWSIPGSILTSLYFNQLFIAFLFVFKLVFFFNFARFINDAICILNLLACNSFSIWMCLFENQYSYFQTILGFKRCTCCMTDNDSAERRVQIQVSYVKFTYTQIKLGKV